MPSLALSVPCPFLAPSVMPEGRRRLRHVTEIRCGKSLVEPDCCGVDRGGCSAHHLLDGRRFATGRDRCADARGLLHRNEPDLDLPSQTWARSLLRAATGSPQPRVASGSHARRSRVGIQPHGRTVGSRHDPRGRGCVQRSLNRFGSRHVSLNVLPAGMHRGNRLSEGCWADGGSRPACAKRKLGRGNLRRLGNGVGDLPCMSPPPC